MNWLPGINTDRLCAKARKHIQNAFKEHEKSVLQSNSNSGHEENVQTESVKEKLFQDLYEKPSRQES